MKLARIITIAMLLVCAAFAAPSLPGVPDDFSFSYLPHSGSAYYTKGRAMPVTVDGKPKCVYFSHDTLDAQYSSITRRYVCPAITVRHIVLVDISRHSGECEGFICAYDYTIPSLGYQLTGHSMEYCPDLLFTAVVDGKMKLLGGKSFRRGNQVTEYYRDGIIPDMEFVSESFLIDKCADERYLRQREFWLLSPPKTHEKSSFGDDRGSWDGT